MLLLSEDVLEEVDVDSGRSATDEDHVGVTRRVFRRVAGLTLGLGALVDICSRIVSWSPLALIPVSRLAFSLGSGL